MKQTNYDPSQDTLSQAFDKNLQESDIKPVEFALICINPGANDKKAQV